MSLSSFAILLLIFAIQFSYAQYWPPNICYGRFERYSECATTCPDTCDDIRRPYPGKICNMMCRSGCECFPPFVRANQYYMSPCVHPMQCRFIY